jgi:acyl-ACP thioesterase
MKLIVPFRNCFVRAPKTPNSYHCRHTLSLQTCTDLLSSSSETQASHKPRLPQIYPCPFRLTICHSLPARQVFMFTQYAHMVNEVYISFMKPGLCPRNLLFNYRILIKSAMFVQETWPGHSMIIYRNCHRRSSKGISSQEKLLAHFPTYSPYLFCKYFLWVFF